MGTGDKKRVAKGMPQKTSDCATCDGGDKVAMSYQYKDGKTLPPEGDREVFCRGPCQEVPLEQRRSQPGKTWERAFPAGTAASRFISHLPRSFQPASGQSLTQGKLEVCGPLVSPPCDCTHSPR